MEPKPGPLIRGRNSIAALGQQGGPAWSAD